MSAARVVVLDYGSGNLHSASRALAEAGAEVELTADSARALAADGLVVPGVGAFAACMAQLRQVGGDQVVAERVAAGRPVLGICVGHQVLFASGDEHGVVTPGLGVYPGQVTRVPATRVPHMGWNTVEVPPGSWLFAGVEQERFYFVHSYAALRGEDLPPQALVTWTVHEQVRVVAAVERDGVCSTQFHPEKSGAAGARLLRTWVDRL
ncbi:MAG: imidazole glycerol phosphate synthase subunit HisH [Actinomycetia bacterium]|nr:imidazole glycerol phosphate synthase subunit HisH [Actinomycetes bacterium]